MGKITTDGDDNVGKSSVNGGCSIATLNDWRVTCTESMWPSICQAGLHDVTAYQPAVQFL